jgi:hypothetical protein
MAETMAILSENVTDFLGRLALHFFLFDKTDFGFESILRKSDSDLLLCLLSKLEFIGGSDIQQIKNLTIRFYSFFLLILTIKIIKGFLS